MLCIGIIFFTMLLMVVWHNYTWNPKNPGFYPNQRLMIIGHRGAPTLARENTLLSFKKAIELGVDGIELDVQYSRDKHLIVYHDWDIINSHGTREKIEDLSIKDLRVINQIPSLNEVLEIIPDNNVLNIEIKSRFVKSTGIEKDVIDTVINYNVQKNCIISSFNPFIIRRIKKINPNILTGFLWSRDDPFFILNSPYLAWFVRPDGFHPDIRHLTKKLAVWAKSRKMKILSFTVNTEDNLKKAKDLKIDGIFTDFPEIDKN